LTVSDPLRSAADLLSEMEHICIQVGRADVWLCPYCGQQRIGGHEKECRLRDIIEEFVARGLL
jgi:hypothetical protein